METKLKIAIIGSGPAGVSVGRILCHEFEVTIFDELKKFGGMLAYGLPTFRVTSEVVEKQISEAKKIGINFVQKKIIDIKKLLKENGGEFDEVIIAMGAGKGKTINIPGSELCTDGIEFLKEYKLDGKNPLKKTDCVGVIGGGNSAIDIARTAKRLCDKTSIVYRRTEKEMPSRGNELAEAKKEGIIFEWLVLPKRFEKQGEKIIAVCEEMKLGEIDASGRRTPLPTGKEKNLVFDKIFFGIGQKLDETYFTKQGFELENGWLKVNNNFETNIKNIFAIGDVVTGPKNIAKAIVNGKKLGEKILKI